MYLPRLQLQGNFDEPHFIYFIFIDDYFVMPMFNFKSFIWICYTIKAKGIHCRSVSIKILIKILPPWSLNIDISLNIIFHNQTRPVKTNASFNYKNKFLRRQEMWTQTHFNIHFELSCTAAHKGSWEHETVSLFLYLSSHTPDYIL
jgi:hypothetical protein